MNALTGIATILATAVPTEITLNRPFTPSRTLELIATHDETATASLQAASVASAGILARTKCPRMTTPAAIALSVIGTLASVVALQVVFILVLWRRRKHHDRARKSFNGNIELGTTQESNSNHTSILKSSTSAEPLMSAPTPPSPIPEVLPDSSGLAYEEEIQRLREEVLSQKSLNRIMHEQLELVHSGSPPPSYRSRRSDNSYYLHPSSSLSSRVRH